MKIKRLILGGLSLVIIAVGVVFGYTQTNYYQMTKEPLYYVPKGGVVEDADKSYYMLEQPVSLANGKLVIEEAYYYEDIMYININVEEKLIKQHDKIMDSDEIMVMVDGWGLAEQGMRTETDDDGYIREITKRLHNVRTEKVSNQDIEVKVIIGEDETEIDLIPIPLNKWKNTTWRFKEEDDCQISVIPISEDYSHMGIIIEPKVQETGKVKEIGIYGGPGGYITALDQSGKEHKVIADRSEGIPYNFLDDARKRSGRSVVSQEKVGHYKLESLSIQEIKKIQIEKIIESITFQEGYEPSLLVSNPKNGEVISLDLEITVEGVNYKLLTVSRVEDVVILDIEDRKENELIDEGIIYFEIKNSLYDSWERSGNKITISGIPYNQSDFTLMASQVIRAKEVDWEIRLR